VNIQRGRDHGLPGFNDLRRYYGLDPYTNFSQIHPDSAVYNLLAQAYASIEDCDIYVCALAEFHDYANIGETFGAVIADQYARLRDGDRFWYENNQWSVRELEEIKNTTLRDVILRNTPIGTAELSCFVFAAPDGICGKQVARPAPGPTYQKYDWVITLKKKTAEHPLYGQGHEYGLVVNGIEGPDLEVERGKSYTFHSLITCAHSFTINPNPEDGITPLVPVPAGTPQGDYDQIVPTFGCINWNREQTLNVPMDAPGALYYSCDFHPLMGGNIRVKDPNPVPPVLNGATPMHSVLFAVVALVCMLFF